MKRLAASLVRPLLLGTPLALLPIRVRGGIAQGARWTLYPWTSYWRGTHEPELQRTLLRLGNGNITGWSCWDLGAHFGLYSVGLARRVGPTGQVAAFEPNPVSYARLERHRRMNRLDWLLCFNAAVSDRRGTAELYTYGRLDTTTTHLPYEGEARTDDVGSVAVRTLRLDDLVADGTLRAPDFVKIDVEGHAHHALAGMAATLAQARPTMIIGFHSDAEIGGTLEILRSFGYEARPVGADTVATEFGCADYVFKPVAAARP